MIGLIQDGNRHRNIDLLNDIKNRYMVIGIITKLIHEAKKSTEPEMETDVLELEYLLEQICSYGKINEQNFRYLLKERLREIGIGI